MRRLGAALVGSLLAAALCGEAAADHMTGRYTMVPQDPRASGMSGSVLQLRQSGRMLQGQISGATFRAQLQGETDGGDNARGILHTQDGQRQYFEAVHGADGFRMTLIATDNRGQPDRSASLTLFFARATGRQAPQPGYGPQPGPGGQPGYGPPPAAGGQPGYGSPQQPGSGGPPGYGSQPAAGGTPPGYGTAPGSAPGYGSQPAAGTQPGYGPPGSGAQPSYGGQPGYGPPSTGESPFGTPPGYGGRSGQQSR